jgi:hypothetical protein
MNTASEIDIVIETKTHPVGITFPGFANTSQILDDVEDLVTDPGFNEALGHALSSVREIMGRDGLLEGLLSAVKVITGGDIDKNDSIVGITLAVLALTSVCLPRNIAAALTPLDERINRIDLLAMTLAKLASEGPSGTLARMVADHLDAAQLYNQAEQVRSANLDRLERLQHHVEKLQGNQKTILDRVNDRIQRLGMEIIATEKEILKGNRK